MGGQSSFDHGHVESLKINLGEILACHNGGKKIQYVHGQKMIEPPFSMTEKALT